MNTDRMKGISTGGSRFEEGRPVIRRSKVLANFLSSSNRRQGERPMRSIKFLTTILVAAAVLSGGWPSHAQGAIRYSQAQIEQMVAPIALYPDALLSQVLMAATFPDQVSEADEWLRANSGISEAELDDALATASWDPSVISLCKFPALMDRMGMNMQWTTDLGYAFLSQRSQVFGAVQRLRREAYRAGYLRSTPQQTVVVEPAFIEIRPYTPSIVYVPVYNPAVVYGSAWGYPTYYYRSAWAPSPGTLLVNGFAWGVGFYAAHVLFGGCDWGHHDVYVNKTVIVNNRIFRNTDYYRQRDRHRNGRHQWVRPVPRKLPGEGYRRAPYGGRGHGTIRAIQGRPNRTGVAPNKPGRVSPRDVRPGQTRTPKEEPRRYEPVRQNAPKASPDRNRPAGVQPPAGQRRTYERPRPEAPRVGPGQNRPVRARPAQREQTERNRGQVRENNRPKAQPARGLESGKKVNPKEKVKDKKHKRN